MRSNDKSNWDLIEVVPADANIEDYSITDNSNSGSAAYKLLWFDKDNSFAFATISVGEEAAEEEVSYSLFPNPAQTKVSIETEEDPGFNEIVSVFNTQGGEYKVPAIYVNGQLVLEIDRIPEGMYIVKMPKGFVRFQKD